jgi:pilus assembly protein CpaE
MAQGWTAPGSLPSPLLTSVSLDSETPATTASHAPLPLSAVRVAPFHAAASPSRAMAVPRPNPAGQAQAPAPTASDDARLEDRSIEGVVAAPAGATVSTFGVGPVLLLADDVADVADIARALGDACIVLPTAAARGGVPEDAASARLVVVDAPVVAEKLGLVRRLRGSDTAGRLALLVVTVDQSVEGRIAAFDAGADDVLARPFSDEELTARAEALVRRAERAGPVQATAVAEAPRSGSARLIAVHSLRGGVGATSIAVNLALSLRNLWEAQVLMLDLVPEAGQAGFYLNADTPRSWAQLVERASTGSVRDEIDWVTLHHQSGIDLIASPDHEPPALSDPIPLLEEFLAAANERYDYVVVDLPHDFGPIASRTLDLADIVIVPVAPDLASVRAASIALASYRERGYPHEKVRLVVNTTTGRGSVPVADVEKGLRERVEVVLPYAPDAFLAAINKGRPIAVGDPEQPIARLVSDLAYRISLTRHLLDETRDRSSAAGLSRDRQAGHATGRSGRRGWSLLGRGSRA